MMVLTDTSIWIRYLANRPPYAQELERLLEYDEVAGTISYMGSCS